MEKSRAGEGAEMFVSFCKKYELWIEDVEHKVVFSKLPFSEVATDSVSISRPTLI